MLSVTFQIDRWTSPCLWLQGSHKSCISIGAASNISNNNNNNSQHLYSTFYMPNIVLNTLNAYKYMYICTCIYTYRQRYIHTYAHIHIYIDTHIYSVNYFHYLRLCSLRQKDSGFGKWRLPDGVLKSSPPLFSFLSSLGPWSRMSRPGDSGWRTRLNSS